MASIVLNNLLIGKLSIGDSMKLVAGLLLLSALFPKIGVAQDIINQSLFVIKGINSMGPLKDWDGKISVAKGYNLSSSAPLLSIICNADRGATNYLIHFYTILGKSINETYNFDNAGKCDETVSIIQESSRKDMSVTMVVDNNTKKVVRVQPGPEPTK